MKIPSAFSVMMLILLAGSESVSAQIAEQPVFKLQAPDLAFGKILRKNASVVEILVVNQGKAKSVETEGAFGCVDIEATNGIKLGFSALLAIKPLAPGESWKVRMDCGKGRKILGSGLDGKNKVKESNENNNSIEF